MLIGFRDSFKCIAISIVACCAVFVCALFLNYELDVAGIQGQMSTEAAKTLYDAMLLSGKVTSAVAGGCLGITTLILLLFYIRNYIDTHSRELGVWKAMGYSSGRVALGFWVFGLSVLLGCALGFLLAWAYMPSFYEAQNAQGFFPDLAVQFHPGLALLLIGVPGAVFAMAAIVYARLKLRQPVLELLLGRRERPRKAPKAREDGLPFLGSLRRNTLRSRKILVFFVGFSAFCFSAMTQMSISMVSISSETYALMILCIGLLLAFLTLLLSLSAVVRGNAKSIAMLRVFGYTRRECAASVLGCYRPAAYIGFAVGTAYQYFLLQIMVTVIFANMETMPEYSFDLGALGISLAAFVAVYELILLLYARRMEKLPLRSVMLEG